MCAAKVSLWSNSMPKNWTSFSFGKICPSYVNLGRKCVFFLEAPVEDNGRSFGGRDFEIPCVCPGF